MDLSPIEAIRESTMVECVSAEPTWLCTTIWKRAKSSIAEPVVLELEVIDVNPPVLDRAPELEEDWGE